MPKPIPIAISNYKPRYIYTDGTYRLNIDTRVDSATCYQCKRRVVAKQTQLVTWCTGILITQVTSSCCRGCTGWPPKIGKSFVRLNFTK